MIAKMRFLGVGCLVGLLLAVSASGAWAKGTLDLKEPGMSGSVKNGTTVAAGWYVSFGEKYFCQVVPLEEGEPIKEGSMVLNTNDASKDKASGSVAAPPCYETEETSPPSVALAKYRSHLRRRVRAASGTTISATGTLSGQEMTTAKKGAMTLSAPLVITLETATLKCAYESKTKISAKWPPEPNPEFPNIGKTADLTSEFEFKLDKTLSAKKGCAKTTEGAVESWLGPLGEELEADLVA